MSQHQALSTPDILYEIFDQCKTSVIRPESTLARCTQVCKAFFNPAARALWRAIPNILPLLQLLSSLKRIEKIPNGHYEFMFCGAISKQDWIRFRQYAKLVREVRFGNYSLEPIEPSVWVYLMRQNAGEPLLPHLHTLIWEPWEPFNAALLTIISPSLRFLMLNLHREPPDYPIITQLAIGMLLQSVFVLAPHIRDLIIDAPAQSSSLMAIAGLKHLRKVDVSESGAVDLSLLEHLSTLDDLVELSIHVDISGQDVFGSTGFYALKTLYIKIPSTASLRDVRASFDEIHSRFPLLHTLRYIILPEDSNTAQPTFVLPLHDIIRSLLRLTDLKNVTLNFSSHEIEVSDRDLQNVADAWPGLVSFSLKHTRSSTIPTPQVLLYFARHCPALQILSLPFLDINKAHFFHDWPVMSHGLRCLIITKNADFLHGCLDSLTLSIDRLFPALDIRDCVSYLELESYERGTFEEGWYERWNDVLRLLKMCQAARIQRALNNQSDHQIV